jgi:hypothetical protein
MDSVQGARSAVGSPQTGTKAVGKSQSEIADPRRHKGGRRTYWQGQGQVSPDGLGPLRRSRTELGERGTQTSIERHSDFEHCPASCSFREPTCLERATPLLHANENGLEGTPEFRDLVLDARRHFGVDVPRDDTVRLQRAQLKRDYALRGAWREAPQLAEPLASAESVAHEDRLPPPADDTARYQSRPALRCRGHTPCVETATACRRAPHNDETGPKHSPKTTNQIRWTTIAYLGPMQKRLCRVRTYIRSSSKTRLLRKGSRMFTASSRYSGPSARTTVAPWSSLTKMLSPATVMLG